MNTKRYYYLKMNIQIDLDEKENNILESFMFIIKESCKKTGLKKLIRESENLPKVKEALKLRK